MNLVQDFIFEADVPKLDYVCQLIAQRFADPVEWETQTSTWERDEDGDVRIEKLIEDMAGVEAPIDFHNAVVRSRDDEITLGSIEGTHRIQVRGGKYAEGQMTLHETAETILKELGGKVREVSPEEVSQLNKRWRVHMAIVLVFFAFLGYLYFYHNVSIWRLLLIILLVWIAKFVLRVVLAYRMAKKAGWIRD